MPVDFTISDRKSAAWQKMMQHLCECLETLRKQNDGNLDLESTQKLRGRISQCKALLALDNPMPPVTDD